MLSNIPKVEVHASNESALSDYCRLGQPILPYPPVEGLDAYFDLGIEQDDNGQPDGPHTQFILYADSALWRQLMMTKDL